jgi:hypothetical protein
MTNPANNQEIFRHLRPHWYNRTSHTIEPLTHGGVSFLLKPTAERTYDFWIYICPEDASFSARQAVKSLRDVQARGVVPWGTLTLADDPIIEQLSKFIITEQHVLPSEVGHQVLKIVMVNGYADWKFSDARNKYVETRKHYTA